MTPKITDGGINLMIRALDGDGIEFSKMVLGNGGVPDDYAVLTGLVNPLAEIGLDSITQENAFVVLEGTLPNSSVEEGFNWAEIGIFCTDPDGGDDILYAYGHYLLDDDSGAIYLPKFGSSIIDLTIKVYVYVGDIENVTAALADSSEYAKKADLEGHIEDITNPHHVTAEQVGLGNVPNVETNNQTPTYTVASVLAEMVSGETLAVAFGKVSAAVKSLITHLADATAHITSSERSTWNSKADASHTHSATDITSGTLGVSRGGTSASTAEGAAHALYAMYGGTVSTTYRITSSKNMNSYRTGGTYWCATAEVAATLSNCPWTSSNFILMVFSPNSTQTFQMLLPNSTSDSATFYFRSYNNGWTSWKKVSASAV